MPGAALSRAAAEVLARIRGPITIRCPVGYDEAFLRGYEPSEDWYLSVDLRERLREVVLDPQPPQRALPRRRAEAHDVLATDLEAFAGAALGLLIDLHEGTLYRYGLRQSDLTVWRDPFGRGPRSG